MRRSQPYSLRSNGDGDLVEVVRGGQRSSPQWRRAWQEYCDEHADGAYDPARHSGKFLKDALLQLGLPEGAPPGSGGGGRAAGGSRGGPLDLVDEVKAIQREGRAAAQAWRDFCDDQGGGSYDPSRHERAFLRAALRHIQRQSGGGGGGGALSEQVKELCRNGMRDRWCTYCDRYGDGSYDPARYAATWLRGALQALGGGGRGPGGGGPLSERCKELQRSSEAARLVWEEHCDTYGGGSYDPALHPASFVEEALAKMERRVDRPGPGGAGDLVDRVKQLQRESPEARERWVQICEAEGDGVLDPTRHQADYLTSALRRMQNAASGERGNGRVFQKPQRVAAPAAGVVQVVRRRADSLDSEEDAGLQEEIASLRTARQKAIQAGEKARAARYAGLLADLGAAVDEDGTLW